MSKTVLMFILTSPVYVGKKSVLKTLLCSSNTLVKSYAISKLLV